MRRERGGGGGKERRARGRGKAVKKNNEKGRELEDGEEE